MFKCCESLKSLPDISKWTPSNNINIKGLFDNCKSLTSFPDISKWKKENDSDDSNCSED